MAECCYRSDDWCTIGCFSATAGLLVLPACCRHRKLRSWNGL